jgi:hypothetical protein
MNVFHSLALCHYGLATGLPVRLMGSVKAAGKRCMDSSIALIEVRDKAYALVH